MAEIQSARKRGRQNEALFAMATLGPDEASKLGYGIEPEAAQTLMTTPNWQENVLTYLGKSKDKDESYNKFLSKVEDQSFMTVKDFNKRSTTIRGAYGKMQKLHGKAKAGDRTAAAGMVMSLSRLFSPGVVTDKDVQQIAAAQNPWSMFLDILADKKNAGVPGAADFAKYIDPIGNVNADSLLAVANDVALAEAPALISSYQSAADIAQRSGLPQRQYHTIFGGNQNLDYLQTLLNQPSTAVGQPVQAEPMATPPARTRTVEEVDRGATTPKRIKFDAQGNMIQ